MNGRGIRFLFISIAFLSSLLQTGFCQNSSEPALDYTIYFTKPERDGSLVFVFYNNFIEKTDNVQFGYALIYGLEYASENAESGDMLAVGLYFANDKGKIYLIRKKDFDQLRDEKITAEELLDYLKVETVDLNAVQSKTTTNQ